MAWRNCQQAISATIPQLMLTDENANAFMQALIAAGDNTSAKTAAYNTYVKPLLLNTYCQTNDLVSEKIAGNDTNYINCTVSGGFANIYFYYDNTQQTAPQLSQSKLNNWVCGYVACVDDENHVGYWQGFTVFIRNPLDVGNFGGTQPRYSGESANKVYTILTGNEYHQYTWQSVPAISGKNGILSLSTADNSYHTGSDVSNIPLSDVSLTDSSKLSSLGANLPVGGTIDAIYAGSIDHINVTRVSLASIKLDIILAGQSIFSGSFLPSDYLGFLIDEENEVAVMVGYRPHVEADIITGYDERVYTASAEEMYNIWRFLHPHTEGNPEDNEPDEGTPDDYQPDIAITGIEKPPSGAYDTGFTSQYRMSDTQLKSLAQFLWSSSFLDNVKKFFNDPREIIVGLTIMPVLPDTGSSKEVKAGGISTGVYGLPLTDQYKLDTYGSITIKKEKGNFLDYNPYTRVTAHLPFVGEHTLDVNDVMGKTLTLKYIFDFLSGSCVAEIDVNGKPRYFFGGSCGLQIPTSSQDFTRMYSSVLSAGATLGSTLATIATGGLTAPLAIGSAANMLSNGMNGSPTVQFSSGSGSVNGMIGCKTAYLVIEKPIEKISANQKGYIGKPSYMTKSLSSCSGFTKCLKVHLDSVPCTSQERDDIESALTNGVRIETGSATPTYTPSSSGMQGLILLKCLSDFDVIGKTWSETTQTVEGKLLYNQSFLSPSFLVSGNYSEYNYAYIPAFGRFYYIKDHIAESGNMTRIEMQVDALQSFKDQILANNAVLERQESLNNAYFADSMYWTQVNKVVKTVPFTDGSGNELKFSIPEDNFILTIAGGE